MVGLIHFLLSDPSDQTLTQATTRHFEELLFLGQFVQPDLAE